MRSSLYEEWFMVQSALAFTLEQLNIVAEIKS